jgi:hypothetical protein
MTNTRSRMNDAQRRLDRATPKRPPRIPGFILEHVAGRDDPYHAPLEVLSRRRYEFMSDAELEAAIFEGNSDAARTRYLGLSDEDLLAILDMPGDSHE